MLMLSNEEGQLTVFSP